MPHLFTYGTLMFPEVWKAVVCPDEVGREFQTLHAELAGYQIFRVKDAVYPGIIAGNPSPSGRGQVREHSSSPTSDLRPLTSVSGLLYLNLDAASIARLDAFEDDFYRRQSITVTCNDVTCDDGRELKAEAYVVPENRRDVLTTEIWTPEEFQARGHLAEFVARYAGFNRLN